jgi:protein associated with RNAse G/E
MQTIQIASSKYDGSPRDEYSACLYAEDAERLVVYAPPGTMGYDHRRQAWSAAPDGLLEIYHKARWYTVWHICERHSNVNQMYIHISMPATRSAAGVVWVDLDLDYRVYADGRIELFDEAEYLAHVASMRYPEDLQAQVRAACLEVEAGYAGQIGALDHRAYAALYQQIKDGLADG